MSAPNDPNLSKLIRPDGRIVFHHGNPTPPLPADGDMSKAYHLGPYKDGAVDVPAHWWNARVTDRTNCPIVIKRSPAQLVAANRMFAYGNTGCIVTPPTPKRVPYTQMGSSDIWIGMPGTGERPDIGLITDNSGYFMMGLGAAPMIDWALSAESCPMHFRDPTTDRPIDLLKNPLANSNDRPGYGTWLVKGPPGPNPLYGEYGGGWIPQQAHYCEMSYVAYQATGDVGFLEDLQFSANFTVLCDASVSYHFGKALCHGEYRGVAWALRNLFMAHVSTADYEAACIAAGKAFPSYLHPSSYWKSLLDNALDWYSDSMTTPSRQALRIVSDMVVSGNPNVVVLAPWQCDYMLTALAFGVLTSHADWTPLYLWALKNVIDRTSGDDLPVGYGVPYYVDGTSPDWKTAMIKGVPGLGGAEPATAAELAALAIDPYNKGIALRGRDYLMETRAALVMALYVHLKGLADVKSLYPKLDTCVDNVDRMLRSTKNAAGQNVTPYMNPRVSVVLDATQAPTTVTPLPSPTPAPPPPPPVVTPPPPVPVPPALLPATIPGIAARVNKLKTIVGVP